MRKTIYLMNVLLAIALLSMLVAVLSVTHSVAFAVPEDNAKTNVSVTGDGIVEGNNYYLQWSNLPSVYNGSSQTPSAVLKCNEDASFEKVATVSIENKMGEAVTAENAGDYVALAECDGISFLGEGENKKEFSISPSGVAVNWGDTKSYTYNGNMQGPTASYADVSGASHTLTSSGLGTNVGTYTASVTADAAGGNYILTNLMCGYTISPLSVAVNWDKAESYTYSGQAQGPTASYIDVSGVSHTLTVNGYGTDAGSHTASVIANAAGGNYTLTNLTCGYTISPLSVAVNWNKAESYTYSGQAQGPTASYTDVGGASHTLTSSGLGTNVGTYMASVTADAAGGNYTLTNLTCGYTISPLSVAVNWDKAESYTYSGQAQGPTASYTDVSGVSHTLTSSGLGTNVGTYTVSVTADAAGGNYILNNLTCEYEIGKLIGKVLWVVADYYIANGQPQVPRAFVVGVNGDFIELPIKGAGTKAGEYTAEIDLSKVDSNIELSGGMSYRYVIKPEALFGPVGTALSIIFGIIFVGSAGFIIYWFCFRKKKDDEQLKENEQSVSKLQDDINERDRVISGLQHANQSLIYDLAAVQDEMEQAKNSLFSLEKKLAETKQKLAEAKRQLSETESTDIEAVDKLKNEVKNLSEQVRSLSEENGRLKTQKPQEPDFYKHPIEDYFPEIDEAYRYAESCNYDPSDPKGSFTTQRKKLRDIMNIIAIYRSQRR